MWFWMLLAGVAAILFFSHLSTYLPVIKHQSIDIPSLRQGQDLHILHLTDLHMERLSITPRRLYRLIQHQRVDLVAMTGDFLDQAPSLKKLEGYLAMLEKVAPPYGIYAVLGNHDYQLPQPDLERLIQLLESYGVKVLRNNHVTVRLQHDCIYIIGVDDAYTQRDDVTMAYQDVDAQKMRLVLAHDPHTVFKLGRNSFDLLLAGHFHGGQIFWPRPYHLLRMGSMPRQKIYRGLHYYLDQPYYISQGLGQTMINARLGSRPEISFHHLKGTGYRSQKLMEKKAGSLV